MRVEVEEVTGKVVPGDAVSREEDQAKKRVEEEKQPPLEKARRIARALRARELRLEAD